jgi:glyoxylase-like metal-dependent hydrolase (beta-lactamase superfamily II)
MYRIANGISGIEGTWIGRMYVIEAPDGLTLIDSSIPGAFPRIEKDLQRAGHQLDRVKRILITHAHWDHYGSLAALKEATGARVYAHHRYESAVIRGEKKPDLPLPSQLHGFDRLVSTVWIQTQQKFDIAVKVDHELKEGDRLDEVLPGLEVVDTPGHSLGHCGFWQPEQGLFFGGDVMMRMPSGRLMLPLASATRDLEEAKRSVQKVAELQVETLCLGHGKPIIGNAAAAISAFASKLS